MGYFSNGTEAEMYEAEYCDRCQHWEGCAVWFAHMEHNYEECNNEESILHILIPRTRITNEHVTDFPTNGECRMFIPQQETPNE